MKTKRTVPKLETHQLVWIFDAAREHFSEAVRDLQLDICRLKGFPDTGPLAEHSWVARVKPSKELLAEKQTAIDRYLPVIEFCDAMREAAAEMSAREFGAAFRAMMDEREATKPDAKV